MIEQVLIQPKTGHSFVLRRGDSLTIEDVQGQQVASLFAVNLNDSSEFFSAGATIACIDSIKMGMGDVLYSNRYRAMFDIVQDDVGEHDILHPCCSCKMFACFYGHVGYHPNCLDNINEQMQAHGLRKHASIQPLNVFMRTVIQSEGSLSVETPVSKPGDCMTLRARMDVIAFVAACSVSQSNCNGGVCTQIKATVDRP